MSGYFKRKDCKGRHDGARLCKAYRGTSPRGDYNPSDIDRTGYCRDCRRTRGMADGQMALFGV